MKITKQWLLQSARSEAERHFDSETGLCLIPRETAWYAITLLASDKFQDQALGNQLLSHLNVHDGTHSPCTLVVIERCFRDRLSPSAKQQIRMNLKNNLPISATVRYTDGNVNHPLAAYVNLIITGELFQDPAYVKLGISLLQEFQQKISGRKHAHLVQAEMAEYNSPTYTALDLWFLAIAAEYARNETARKLADFLEEQLWINVAMHWHPPTQQFAGPFSRAYAEDSLGGFSALHCTFGFAMKNKIFIDPELPRKYQHPSALIENAFIALLNFHVPDAARRIAFEKPLPYAFRMTTYGESYHENKRQNQNDQIISTFDTEIYPGGWSDLTSFLTAEYCLGSASQPYVNGAQTDTFSLRYRCAPVINKTADFRSAFTRMVFNGAVIGQTNHCHVLNGTITPDYLYEEGRPFVIQYQNKAIVGYVPKRAGHAAVNEIRLDLIFSYDRPFDQLWVDGKPITQLPYEGENADHIIIGDFRTWMVIFPFKPGTLANFNGKFKIWKQDRHCMFSFYNYQGQTIDFTREQMSMLFNGFACFLASVEDFSVLSDLEKYLAQVKVSQKLEQPFIHHLLFQMDENLMSFKFDPLAERIIERLWNGQDLAITHFDVSANGGFW